MRPQYKEQIIAPMGESKVVPARIPVADAVLLRAFALGEGDTVNGLVREGILRVIEDRINDKAYLNTVLEELSVEGLPDVDELKLAVQSLFDCREN